MRKIKDWKGNGGNPKCNLTLIVRQCYVVNNLICNLKTTYYRDVISENSGNQKVLFKTVNKLLQKSCVKRDPPSSDACSLANAFADFFTQKIDKTHAG